MESLDPTEHLPQAWYGKHNQHTHISRSTWEHCRRAVNTSMKPLSEYERSQVDAIAGWKAEPPALLVEVIDAVTHPVAKLAERFIPLQLVKDAIKIAYQNAETLAHREAVAEAAGVKDVRELRHADLATCDRLAEKFARDAAQKAAVRSAAVSAGPVLAMEISTMYCLKTAHMVGYCYGYTPEDPREKFYVMQILLAAAAGSLSEKQKALVDLHSIEDELVEDIVENVIEGQVEEMVDRAVEDAAGRAIPLIGYVTQSLTNAMIAYHTGEVAKKLFQERWLRAQGKVSRIEPNPALARTRFERAETVLSNCIYWPCYFASFAAAFPVMLVASAIPKQNAVMQGFADGAKAAGEDLKKLRGRLGRKSVTTPEAAPMPLLGST